MACARWLARWFHVERPGGWKDDSVSDIFFARSVGEAETGGSLMLAGLAK